jgi:hypothetical protein
MQRLEVSGAVRLIYGSLGFKLLIHMYIRGCLDGKLVAVHYENETIRYKPHLNTHTQSNFAQIAIYQHFIF